MTKSRPTSSWSHQDLRRLRLACEAGGISEAMDQLASTHSRASIKTIASDLDLPISRRWTNTEIDWMAAFAPHADENSLYQGFFFYRSRASFTRKLAGIEWAGQSADPAEKKRVSNRIERREWDFAALDADWLGLSTLCAYDAPLLIPSVVLLCRLGACSPGDAWLSVEDAVLFWSYRRHGGKFAEAVFDGRRSLRAIHERAKVKGLTPSSRWTEPEIASLKRQYQELYPGRLERIVVPGRSEKSIVCKLVKLGMPVDSRTWMHATCSTGRSFKGLLREKQVAESEGMPAPGVGRAQKRWSTEEEQRLMDLYVEASSVDEVATALGRGRGAVTNKASALGLTMPNRAR